ncbi:hypothetical protein D3C86_1904930 [compost metagenome]
MGAGRIGLRRGAERVVDRVDGGAVYLIEPVEPTRDPGRLLQGGAVSLDPGRLVAHMGPQVQAAKDPFADTAIPGGRQRPH